MGIMPYHVEFGSFMMSMESFYNEDLFTGSPLAALVATKAVQRRLKDHKALVDLLRDFAAQPTLVEVLKDLFTEADKRTAKEMKRLKLAGGPVDWRLLLGRYFMGLGYDKATKAWSHQPPPGANLPPKRSTGHLVDYFGNVERILATTLVRAIEASLGLAPAQLDEAKAASPPPKPGDVLWAWPLSFVLVCESPWFEGWVTWQAFRPHDVDPRGGHVAVTYHTPGHGGRVVDDPLNGPNSYKLGAGAGVGNAQAPPASKGYADDTGSSTDITVIDKAPVRPAERGSWIVTHPGHSWFACATSAQSAIGQWTPPLVAFHYALEYDDVVTVSPAFLDGGVIY